MADLNKISNYDSIHGPLGPMGDPDNLRFDTAQKVAGEDVWRTKAFSYIMLRNAWRQGNTNISTSSESGVLQVPRVVQHFLRLNADGETFSDGGTDAQIETRIAYSPSKPKQIAALEMSMPLFETRPITNKVARYELDWTAGIFPSITVTHIPDFTIPLVP